MPKAIAELEIEPSPNRSISRRSAVEDATFLEYRDQRVTHWNSVATWMDEHGELGASYHARLAHIYRFFIPKGARVLEIGCARGDLLAALEPGVGVGIDFSSEMIRRARSLHPQLRFIEADAHALEIDETFDWIILSDVINDLWDLQTVLEHIRKLATPSTRLVFNFYNRLWELPLSIARRLGLARPNLHQNWFTVEDLTGLLSLVDFEVIRHREEVLLPLYIPLVSSIANRYLVKVWPLTLLAVTHFIVARPVENHPSATEPRVSVIVPARNEAGNIDSIFERMPELGSGTELVFVEGGSSDGTYEALEDAIARNTKRNCQLLKQSGKGKGDAVRLGFAHAHGDVLMILDSDLTVPPEDLPRFVSALVTGKADFVNGSRLVYPMESDAMRFANLWANKFFSLAFSWLLDQPIKDTLCGTKVLWKKDYLRIAANRDYFGDFDPFGDFDLLFGASKLGLKIVDLPVRYRDRIYGTTQIQRWRHGWLLLRMVFFAAGRIKFI
jgi:ubiquinone/menaquinone biosynthesis C-methylase UbiE